MTRGPAKAATFHCDKSKRSQNVSLIPFSDMTSIDHISWLSIFLCPFAINFFTETYNSFLRNQLVNSFSSEKKSTGPLSIIIHSKNVVILHLQNQSGFVNQNFLTTYSLPSLRGNPSDFCLFFCFGSAKVTDESILCNYQ